MPIIGGGSGFYSSGNNGAGDSYLYNSSGTAPTVLLNSTDSSNGNTMENSSSRLFPSDNLHSERSVTPLALSSSEFGM